MYNSDTHYIHIFKLPISFRRTHLCDIRGADEPDEQCLCRCSFVFPNCVIPGKYLMIPHSSDVWLLQLPSPNATSIQNSLPLTFPMFHHLFVSLHVSSLPLPPHPNLMFCWVKQRTGKGQQAVWKADFKHGDLSMYLLTKARLFCWTLCRTWWWKLSEGSLSWHHTHVPSSCHLWTEAQVAHPPTVTLGAFSFSWFIAWAWIELQKVFLNVFFLH